MHEPRYPYYAAMAYGALQSYPQDETFTRVQGHLITMFEGCAKQARFSVASAGISTDISQVKDIGSKLSKNSRQ